FHLRQPRPRAAELGHARMGNDDGAAAGARLPAGVVDRARPRGAGAAERGGPRLAASAPGRADLRRVPARRRLRLPRDTGEPVPEHRRQRRARERARRGARGGAAPAEASGGRPDPGRPLPRATGVLPAGARRAPPARRPYRRGGRLGPGSAGRRAPGRLRDPYEAWEGVGGRVPAVWVAPAGPDLDLAPLARSVPTPRAGGLGPIRFT